MQGRMRGWVVALACVLAVGCRPRSAHEPSTDDRARRSTLVQSMVGELMSSARVTAIGEGTHGTRELRDALHDATVVGLRDHALAVERGAARSRPDSFDRVVFFTHARADR